MFPLKNQPALILVSFFEKIFAKLRKPQFDVSSIGPTEMKGFLLNPSPKLGHVVPG